MGVEGGGPDQDPDAGDPLEPADGAVELALDVCFRCAPLEVVQDRDGDDVGTEPNGGGELVPSDLGRAVAGLARFDEAGVHGEVVPEQHAGATIR